MPSSDRDPRVLVVEDDEEIAQVLQRSLRLDGYEVRWPHDGETALAEASAYHPDLVILDLGLPRLDGIEGRPAPARRRRRADPDADRPRRRRVARRRARLPAPTTTSSSRSSARSSWPACGPSCAGARPAARPRSSWATWPSTPTRTRCAAPNRPVELTQREFELLEYLMRKRAHRRAPPAPCSRRSGATTRFATTNTIEVFVFEPAAATRSRGRGTAAAYDPRRGICPPRLTGSRSAGGWQWCRRP